MKQTLAIVAALSVALYVLALAVPLDPDEQRPGTRLAGTQIDTPVTDWSFHQPGTQVYLQTRTWYGIPHSVTTTSMVYDNQLIIPCGWCGDKRWPKNVAADPAVVVKIGDRLYPFNAVRIEDPALMHAMLGGQHGQVPDVQLYRMTPR